MNKTDQKKRTRAITLIAQGQTIGGSVLVIGQGMKPLKTEQTPYRILNGVPIFYIGNNAFELEEPEFPSGKLYKWGEYYHPYLLVGMPSVGGWNKVYVDTRYKGWYVLVVSTKLDEWAIGPSDWEASIIAWTPKTKYDSINEAGYRMFWAAALALDCVQINEYFSDDFDENGKWSETWNCSTKCKQVFASIRKTAYKNKTEFLNLINKSPDILKHYIELRKLINTNDK